MSHIAMFILGVLVGAGVLLGLAALAGAPCEIEDAPPKNPEFL